MKRLSSASACVSLCFYTSLTPHFTRAPARARAPLPSPFLATGPKP
jgi:hypothetical protein